MRIETVGSAEALLQLFYVAQGTNGYRPNPAEVWKIIVNYTRETTEGHAFSAYLACSSKTSSSAANRPAPLFLGDLQELLAQGVIRLQPDGSVEVTAFGKCLAFARSVPSSLTSLQSRVENLAISHHS
jgi:hypothetical protein